MKKAIPSSSLFLVLLLFGSCQALHRDIPKSKHRSERRELVSFKEKAVVTGQDETPADQEVSDIPAIAPLETGESQLRPEIVANSEAAPITESNARGQLIVPVPQGDTLVVEEEIDEAIVDEALESERIAHQAYQFSFLPLFTLIFFPMLFVGVIGTLSKLARFKRYEYVTEKGLEYERKAKRTLVASIVIPLVLFVFFILLIIAVL